MIRLVVLGDSGRFLQQLGAVGGCSLAVGSLARGRAVRQSVGVDFPLPSLSELPSLKPQEIPLDHPVSTNLFRSGLDKPFVATPAAIDMYSREVIVACWRVLCEKADQHGGLDDLQVFVDELKPENLWFIEDGPGGAITSLLPSDY